MKKLIAILLILSFTTSVFSFDFDFELELLKRKQNIYIGGVIGGGIIAVVGRIMIADRSRYYYDYSTNEIAGATWVFLGGVFVTGVCLVQALVTELQIRYIRRTAEES